MKKFLNESWLVLTLGVVFALLLAGAQVKMMPTIEANQAAELKTAIANVVEGTAKAELVTIEGVAEEVFKCTDEQGEHVGWAVKAVGSGFIDRITLVAGLSTDGETLLAIKVIQHSETPGLGNKIEVGYDYPTQYENKLADKPFKVIKGDPKSDYEIEAITGATYSSDYVCDIVNDIIKRIRPKLPTE